MLLIEDVNLYIDFNAFYLEALTFHSDLPIFSLIINSNSIQREKTSFRINVSISKQPIKLSTK